MDAHARGVTLYKRWRLREGATVERVIALVQDQVVPHYRRLSADARLELEQLDPSTVLAIQRWPSRAVLDEALSGHRFDEWWQQYLPVLRDWDTMLELDAEWEGSVLLRTG